MAGSAALLHLQCHINRAAGRPPGPQQDYQPAPLLDSIRQLASESPQVRHMMAGTLLSSRVPLTEREHLAVFTHLVPEAATAAAATQLADWHRGGVDRQAAIRERRDPLAAMADVEPSAWISWDEHSQVSQNGRSTTASAWLRTSEPLALIAPKLDPQEWDTLHSFIDETFGIDPAMACGPHTSADETPFGKNGYQDKLLHETVSISLGPLSAGVSCDLVVSFRANFNSIIPNHALYELRCNHQGWIDRDEGHCYVKEDAESRLLFASKHLSFTDDAPPLLTQLGPLFLPLWLRLIMSNALL